MNPTAYNAFQPERWGEATKIVVENNYFGDCPNLYNTFELNCSVADGSKFNGNTFTKGASTHNFINLYQVESGTEEKPVEIEIKNNTFDCGPETKPIRIGFKGAPENVKIYIEGNKYIVDPETEDLDYTGLFFIQPYNTDTESLAGVTIYLKDNDIPDGINLFYYYSEIGSDTPLVTLNEALLPKVFLWETDENSNGHWTQLSVLRYLSPYSIENEFDPLMAELEVTDDSGNSGDSGNSDDSGDSGDSGESGNSDDTGNTGDNTDSGDTTQTGGE